MTTWHLSPDWGFVDRPAETEHGGRLYAAPLITGEISILEGASAVVTRAALAGGDIADIRTSAARDLEVASEDIDLEVVEEVLGELVAMGFLTPAR